MPIPVLYRAEFVEEGVYHVYNQTNNNELLFLTEENRVFFLKRYDKFLSPYMNTLAWSLLPDQFNFVVKIKPEGKIFSHLENFNSKNLPITEQRFLKKEIPLGKLIEQIFKRFFQSYSLSFNKMHHRRGNLFHKCFRRLALDKDDQIMNTLIDVHKIPESQGLTTDFRTYQWSSWRALISGETTNLLRNMVHDLFGGRESFINAHSFGSIELLT